jgi:hypothetical protein
MINRTSGYDPATGICWQFNNKGDRLWLRCRCPAHTLEYGKQTSAWFGRCRSGKRWFWATGSISEGTKKSGWEGTEELAIAAAMAAVQESKHPDKPMLASFWQGNATLALKELNAAKRAAKPSSGFTDSKLVEYLYGRSLGGEDMPAFPVRFRITKKTSKRVFYIRDAEWLDERGAQQRYDDNKPIVSDRDGRIGYVNRQKLEADGSVDNRGVH